MVFSSLTIVRERDTITSFQLYEKAVTPGNRFFIVNPRKGEMKMKKFIAMLLALVMVLSLAACGAKEEAPAANADAPAAEAGAIKLGMCGP